MFSFSVGAFVDTFGGAPVRALIRALVRALVGALLGAPIGEFIWK
ncbi:hypothetical protein RGU70_15390 [Herbaspirillum sp. RTI4]|nr:hypothetical protein [Herbaspirillum sp. RTI4]MDY7579697.1 hypothetical protein [Herbaspirillum sp. RTI4]MEA9983024.1 hypothetical protein [Herbaspirillum sp. RTI4]